MIYTALMYHQTTSPVQNKYYVPIEHFRRQMELICRLNIKSIDLENKDFEGHGFPSVLITFDDGHKSNLDAAEILSELKLKGYFFVVKDFSLNDPEYLSENDISKISEMGHAIGVHGKDHNWWTLKSEKQLISELNETKKWIEDITGKSVSTCAAPGGVLNKKVINLIFDSIPEFKYIRTVKVGINSQTDKLIKIVPIHTNTNRFMFEQSIKNVPLYYAYLKTIYYSKEILRPIYNYIK